MSANKVDGKEPGATRDSKSLEGFVSEYLSEYREYITSKDMDEVHTPQFFKAYPFSAEVLALPNGAVCAIFIKGSRAKFSTSEADFDHIMSRLKAQDLDFMSIFPPFTEFTSQDARKLARTDADRDLRASRRLELLTAAESHLKGIHKDIQSVVDLNPWLDEQAVEQKRKLDNARELILDLYKEVDISREERFSDYMRQLSEIMAFDRAEAEEMAGEIELQMEAALEEMEANLSELTLRVKKMESRLPQEDVGPSIEKMQTSIREMASSFKDIQKDFKKAMTESADIKETVTRDGKRTYNLNERITDLERLASGMNKDSGKESMAAVRALEGRLNVMDKEIMGLARKVNRPEPVVPKPVVIESPVVETVETTPSGATVKKTVKRTTTRKTTRSK